MSIFCSGLTVYADDTKSNEASEYITEAYAAINEKNFDLALEYCNKAIGVVSQPIFYSLKSQILIYQEKYDEALNTLDQAIALFPQYTNAYSEKASIYSQLEKYDEAVKCYKLGIKDNPKDLTLYTQLSYILFETGDNTEILECLEKLIEQDPYHEEALYNLACTYSLINKPDEALSCLKKAIVLSPKNKIYAIDDDELSNIKNTGAFNVLTGIGVYVDGKSLEFDVPPSLEDGRVLLPLRVVFESLGASLEWVDSTKTVKGQMGNISLSLQIGSKTATVNGKEVSLDVPGKIVNGRTLVPVRFVSESFGAGVKWDNDTKTVYVTSKYEDTNNTGLTKQAIFEKLNSSLDILPIDGLFYQPYKLDAKEAKMLFVAKTEDDLKLFNSLSKSEKIEYLNNLVQSNYGDVIGCNPIEASFIYDGKMYYRLNTTYEANINELDLETYKLGMIVNVVEQDTDNVTYRYYYSK